MRLTDVVRLARQAATPIWLAATLVGCSLTQPTKAPVDPLPFEASVAITNNSADPVLVTVGLEGRIPGEPDPRAKIGMYPQYRVGPRSSDVVFRGHLTSKPKEAQLSASVYTERCEWIADLDTVLLTGSVRLVVDVQGTVRAEPFAGDLPGPVSSFSPQCHP